MIEEIKKILERKHIQLNKGMTEEEIDKAEKFYDIEFPKNMKDLLMSFVPVSSDFYNWNDYSEENVSKIKKMLEWPYEGISFDIENNNFWLKEFGEPPESIEERIKVFEKYRNKIPKLIPIFSHRYVVSGRDSDYPILSVYQTDIIYYGSNLLEYFQNEFYIEDYKIGDVKEIPFWDLLIY